MSRGWRIIVLSVIVFVLAANICLFAFSTDGVWSNEWVTIKVFKNVGAHYEFRGFSDFYRYLSTFPGLQNSISTVNYVAAILSGEVTLTGIVVLDVLVKILTVVGSVAELLFAFVMDIINMFIWLIGFFIPNWY